MSGLTDQAAAADKAAGAEVAHQRWEAAMMAELDRVRADLRRAEPDIVAANVGGWCQAGTVRLAYWGRTVEIAWPDLVPCDSGAAPLPAFDQAMLLYHLRRSDGRLPAGRWVSFRECPGGEFYHQAYQGYTGRRLAAAFGADPERFDAAAVGGVRFDGPAPSSWAFSPLPRVPLAACLWPGDDEMSAQASVLFDAHAGFHLPIDGLALLGAGLTGRLLRIA